MSLSPTLKAMACADGKVCSGTVTRVYEVIDPETIVGLQEEQSTNFAVFTDEGSAYQDWLWAVLENGDTALFQFSTGNTLTYFEDVTATGGQARVDALHEKDAIDR